MSHFAGLSSHFDVRAFFLSEDRNNLYKSIDARSLHIVKSGLLQEVTDLLLKGILSSSTMGTRAIGYRQAIEYILRENFETGDVLAFSQFLEKFSAATRHFARRQFVYFRKDPAFLWLQRDKPISSPAQDNSCSRMVAEILHWAQVDRPTFQEVIDRQISHSSRVRKWSQRADVQSEFPDNALAWSALQHLIRASQNGNPQLKRYTFAHQKGLGVEPLVAVADSCRTQLQDQIAEQLPSLRACLFSEDYVEKTTHGTALIN